MSSFTSSLQQYGWIPPLENQPVNKRLEMSRIDCGNRTSRSADKLHSIWAVFQEVKQLKATGIHRPASQHSRHTFIPI